MDENKKPLLSGLREKLQKLINVFVVQKKEEPAYDINNNTLNIAKILDDEGINHLFKSFEFITNPFLFYLILSL